MSVYGNRDDKNDYPIINHYQKSLRQLHYDE